MNSSVEGICLDVCTNPGAGQLLPIEEGLNHFNDLMTGISDRQPLSVLIKSSDTGEVLGGMQGRSSLGLLFIDLFYLPPELRRRGLVQISFFALRKKVEKEAVLLHFCIR